MHSLLPTLVLTGALVAQATHPTTIPNIATGTYFAGASSFPLGRTGGRAQYWYRGDQLTAPSVVNAIGPRAARNTSGAGRTQSLEITMSNTTLPYSQFTNAFAQNLGATATVVLARTIVNLPALTSQQNPDAPMAWFMLDAPFPLLGPNLVLDFDLGSAVGAASAVYNGDLMTLASPGRHLTSDPSCGGTLTATSTTAAYNLAMAGATPSQAALIMLAYQASTFAGAPLPIPLDGAGMPGCLLGVDPLLFVGGVADGSGAFSLSIPLALPAEAMVIYAQGLHIQPSIPAGVATTNVTRSILGFNGFCRYIYNFTVDGPNAQNGPNSWQGAMLLQP
jgi:hypothetical protein